MKSIFLVTGVSTLILGSILFIVVVDASSHSPSMGLLGPLVEGIVLMTTGTILMVIGLVSKEFWLKEDETRDDDT